MKSVGWCEGTPVLPGIRKRLFYINKKFILAWPTLTKNSIGQVTDPTYKGNFTLAEGAKWQYVDIIADKSAHTSEPQGEYPSMTQLNKLTAVHPGTGEDASLLASVMNNSNNVFICETADGKYRVTGCEMYDIKCTVNQDLGQGATGTASTTINVEATDIIPAPFYNGEIVTEDGTINEGVGA